MVNIEDYLGAGDHTHAFQSAVWDALSTGESIDVPRGQYWFPRSVVIPGSTGLQIRGSGWRTELFADAGLNDAILRFDSSEGEIRGFRLADVRLTGNHAEQNAGGGVLAAGAVQCFFDRVWFHGCYDYGLLTDKIAGLNLFGHHTRISDCLFDGGRASAGRGLGWWNLGTDENMIRDTDFEDLGGAADNETGAIIDQGGLTTMTGGAMVNNRYGYRVKDTGRVSISGTKFDGNQENAVVISGDECKVYGTTFLEGKAGKSYILMNNGGGNQISLNDFTTPDGAVMESMVRETGNSRENIVGGNVTKLRTPPSGNAYSRRQPTTGIWTGNIVRS